MVRRPREEAEVLPLGGRLRRVVQHHQATRGPGPEDPCQGILSEDAAGGRADGPFIPGERGARLDAKSLLEKTALI